MKSKYQERQLAGIARECQEFEHIICAMGYGYSLLNVSEEDYHRRCDDCVHWLSGTCNIFQDEIHNWQ